MTTQHTPGPWHWVNPYNDQPPEFEKDSAFSLRTVEYFGEAKTETIDGKKYTSFALPKEILSYAAGVTEANARLIADAPELLARLTRAANMLDVLGSRKHEDFVAECFDLIARVNGETS